MRTEVKKLPKSEVEILVELDPTEWGKFIDEAAKDLAREVKIEGFRPGMAPKELVEQKVGQGKILEAAADLAVRRSYLKILDENKIDAIGQPQIQILKVAPANPFEFKIKTAVLPEVKLGDYKKIARADKPQSKDKIKVEAKEVQESLDWLQKSRTKYATVVRPAQLGDRIEIDFTAKQNGQLIEGGESKNHPLILGEGRFVPGFEDNLAGLKEKEEKQFSLLFPEDFKPEKLAGQLVDFSVKVNLVQEPQVPEFNDDFAKSLGNFENLAALKANVEEGIAMEKEQKVKEAWRAKTLQAIVKKSDVELPEILVQGELNKIMEEFKGNIAQMGMELGTYLANIKKTEEQLRQEWLPKATERAQAGLVLRQIARQENIEVSQQEAEEEINKLIKHYPDWETLQSQIDIKQFTEYTRGRLINEKVFELLEKCQ